jgi:hypothetical protein
LIVAHPGATPVTSITTVPFAEEGFDSGTCATEGFELVNVTTGTGDFVIEVSVATADVLAPADNP